MYIPETWAEGLRAIQNSCSGAASAVIAGGALRDLDNNRSVKDIDVFITGYQDTDLFGVRAALMRAGMNPEEVASENWYPLGENNEVVGFFDLQLEAVSPFQIIIVKWDTKRIVDRFDFGICKQSYDGRTLVTHSDYVIDRDARQFRLCRERDDDQLVASIKRYARLSIKYPGWDFKLFQKYAEEF